MFHRNCTKSWILCVFLEKPGCSSLQNTENNHKIQWLPSWCLVDWLCSVACAMFSTKNCILPPFLAFPWNSSCQFEKEKTTLIILLNSEIASTFICYMIFAQKSLKLAFFSCKMLFSAPKQPSFVDDTVCLTCWQAGKKGCNPWAFTPAAENLKFFFPPVGPFFNHTPPDPRNLAEVRSTYYIRVCFLLCYSSLREQSSRMLRTVSNLCPSHSLPFCLHRVIELQDETEQHLFYIVWSCLKGMFHVPFFRACCLSSGQNSAVPFCILLLCDIGVRGDVLSSVHPSWWSILNISGVLKCGCGSKSSPTTKTKHHKDERMVLFGTPPTNPADRFGG